ncbi:hypothetical protein N3C_2646 [Clostridium sp. N3C]|uniref:hypothetical protein n=1 Tax=Clostridium sp. N3C TaxID=1776758 RepID=UPI00092E1D82|nr:hypothetical protein [Clostridium sp. N3C]SCN26041.1 hypothetical protein N3C_2646 [Clostridium sp. N3C]
MSYENSHKEYLYSIYMKMYPEELEKAISYKLSNIDLERRYGDRKVDMSGYCNDNRKFMIEVQLNTSDEKHFKQLIELINMDIKEKLLIAWVAPKFTKEYLLKIKQNIVSLDKNIEFMAFRLNEDVIKKLEEINSLELFNQIEALKQLNDIKGHLSLIEGIKTYNEENIIGNEEKNDNYNYKQQFLLELLKELREDCNFFPNVYQYKSLDYNRIILGSGYQDIDFAITYNRKGLVGVEVKLNHTKGERAYFKLLDRKSIIEDQLDYLISVWDSNCYKIATYVNPNNYRDKERLAKYVARIAKKYICIFSKHIKEVIELSKEAA